MRYPDSLYVYSYIIKTAGISIVENCSEPRFHSTCMLKLDFFNRRACVEQRAQRGFSVSSEASQSCPTLRPRGSQPARLLRPWDFPGKNTGVGCHLTVKYL